MLIPKIDRDQGNEGGECDQGVDTHESLLPENTDEPRSDLETRQKHMAGPEYQPKKDDQ